MATIPSIAMIPSGVKASKLYSVLPTDGAGDFTTTRASVATRVNENGLIEEVASNVPRLDYSDGGCPSLLLEPTATNLVTYSEDFSDASWAKGNVTLTSNSAISPDGTLNADLLTFTASSGNYIEKGGTITIGQTYTVSCYVKSAVSSSQTFKIYGNANKLSATLTATTEWQRFTHTFTSDISNLSSGFVSSDLSQLHIYGFQLEQNSYSTSYVKTVGTTQTRVADTASGSGNSTVINSTEGVLYFEGSALADDGTDRKISISDGTSGNDVVIGFSRFSGSINGEVHSAGIIQTTGFGATGVTQDNNNKFALSWGGGVVKLYVNGIQTNIDTGATSPIGLNQLRFSYGNGTHSMFSKTKSVQVYKTALTDAELTTLTTI